jgi:hypothetical protein
VIEIAIILQRRPAYRRERSARRSTQTSPGARLGLRGRVCRAANRGNPRGPLRAGSRIQDVVQSRGRERCALSRRAIAGEAKARKTEEHHRPGRRLGHSWRRDVWGDQIRPRRENLTVHEGCGGQQTVFEGIVRDIKGSFEISGANAVRVGDATRTRLASERTS